MDKAQGIYPGDEVNAIVIDVGSHNVKAGYAGEDTPKAVFPSVVGALEGSTANGVEPMQEDGADKASSSQRTLKVGQQAMYFRRDQMEVVSPFGPDELFDDWDVVEGLWDHVLKERLRVTPSEHPMMLAEPSFNSKEVREKMVELMFEKLNVPAVFIAKNAVLSSFATGRQTSLVVDAGHLSTTVAAVHDGYVLQKSVNRTPLAGQILTQCMQHVLEARANGPVRPRYSFKRVEQTPGVFTVESLDFPNTRESYRQWAIEQIAADAKESICRVSDRAFVEENNTSIPTVPYELPDGTEIHVGADRFKIPEILFQPQLIASFPGAERLRGGSLVAAATAGQLPAVPQLVLEAVARCDADVRRELYSGVILTGGTSLLDRMRERLEKELLDNAPQVAKVKLISPAASVERRFSVWIGGSILASLGSFQQMWMSRQEYDDHGKSLIHRKAP